MLETLPAVIVDCATFGLAAIGGYVALNPPREDQIALKRFYVISFVVLAVLGIGANVWQRSIEESRRAQSDASLKSAQKQFSDDLKAVKESSNAILSFVTNPPKGISPEQGLAFAKALRAASRGVPGKFDNISNARVGDMARAIAVNLNEMAAEWRAQDHNDYMVMTDSICYGSSYTPEGCKAAEDQWVIKENDLNVRWREKVKDLVSQANECRMEILNRLLPVQKRLAQDDKAKTLFEGMVADGKNISPDNLDAAGLYLNGLWKRLP